MWVQMLEYISGGRPGGGPWPPRGELLEVDDWEGTSLIRGQLARRAAPPVTEVVQSPVVAPYQMQTPVSTAEVMQMPRSEPAVTAAGPDNPASASAPEAPPRPGDPKAAWVAYAVSQGVNPSEAGELTKVQLQSAYGGRLL